MNSNIGFSSYSQIKTEENESKFKKISENKLLISYILISIIIIILIIIINNRNQIIKNKEEELSEIGKSLSEVNSNINNYEQQINQLENNTKEIIYNLTIIKNEISSIQSEYDQLKTINMKLIYNKSDLQAHKEFINNKIEYIKIFSKEENLKNEILSKKYLFQKINQRLNSLYINESNIITNLDEFKSLAKAEINTKCYDSVVYDFNINKFHNNCDGYPLLILIKTKSGEKIGAFTSITNEGIKNITDEKSMLINFEKNEYFFNNNENKDCFVYSHFDEFPKFGKDLVIYRDGKGEVLGNNCYINRGDSNKYLMEEKKFEIDIMEVYKLKL